MLSTDRQHDQKLKVTLEFIHVKRTSFILLNMLNITAENTPKVLLLIKR